MSSPLFRFGERLRRRLRPEVRISRGYAAWLSREDRSPGPAHGPRISVLLPVHDTDEIFLREAIGSVLAQTYEDWELCIADDDSQAPHVAAVLADMASWDGRVRLHRLPVNAGIAAATNAAFALATGDYIALLDHDDVLAPHALSQIAATLAEHPDAAIVFSDEDQLVEGRRCRPYFKPGWNPDLMLSQNLVSHLGVYSKKLLDRIGGMRAGFDGSQDYDLALRATEAVPPAQIRHIPKVLYHWRQHPHSFSAQREDACRQAARRALADRIGDQAQVRANPDIPQWSCVVYAMPEPPPLVSMILPQGTPPFSDYTDQEHVTDIARAQGGVLLFLAPGLQPMRRDWLHELVRQASRPDIGAAGPRIDGPNGRIREAGLSLDPDEITQSLAPGSDHGDPGYLGHFLLTRNVSALSGACLAIRRDVFDAAGGWDAAAKSYWHVDLCLRLSRQNLRCIWTPHARLRTRTLSAVGPDPDGARFMRARWGKTLAADPYKNPNLVIRHKTLFVAGAKTALRKRLFRT